MATSSIILNPGPSLSRLSRYRLKYAADTIIKAAAGKGRDRFDAHEQEKQLRSGIYTAWQQQLTNATHDLSRVVASNSLYQPSLSEVPSIMHALSTHLSSDAFTRKVNQASSVAIGEAFTIAKQSVDAMFRNQMKRDPIRKDLVGGQASFGVMFGLTEDHALQALVDQLTLSAGGFWDQEMSDSIRKEIESWFNGDLTRDELTNRLTRLVNERLSIEGLASKPASYFDGLTEHYIVRTRNVGSVYRGKSLGAEKYALVNPRDNRTSSICKALTKPGLYFHMAGADQRVSDILGADSLDSLKQVAPFLNEGNASSETSPVPPLHWRCRTWIRFIFAGL